MTGVCVGGTRLIENNYGFFLAGADYASVEKFPLSGPFTIEGWVRVGAQSLSENFGGTVFYTAPRGATAFPLPRVSPPEGAALGRRFALRAAFSVVGFACSGSASGGLGWLLCNSCLLFVAGAPGCCGWPWGRRGRRRFGVVSCSIPGTRGILVFQPRLAGGWSLQPDLFVACST